MAQRQSLDDESHLLREACRLLCAGAMEEFGVLLERNADLIKKLTGSDDDDLAASPAAVDDAPQVDEDLTDWPSWIDPPQDCIVRLAIRDQPCVEMRFDLKAMWEGLQRAGLDASTAARRVHQLRFAFEELRAAETFINQQLREHEFDVIGDDIDRLCEALSSNTLSALASRKVRYLLTCELTTSEEIRRVADRLRPFHKFIYRKRNVRDSAVARFPNLTNQLAQLGLLDQWLPMETHACDVPLEQMAAGFVAAQHVPPLKASTVIRYAYDRAEEPSGEVTSYPKKLSD